MEYLEIGNMVCKMYVLLSIGLMVLGTAGIYLGNATQVNVKQDLEFIIIMGFVPLIFYGVMIWKTKQST